MNEHTQFKIDTSGAVRFDSNDGRPTYLRFEDMTDFTQGVVEAALRGLLSVLFGPDGEGYSDDQLSSMVAYRLLAPATLAQIMADCDRWSSEYGGPDLNEAFDGQMFWGTRNMGEWSDVGFPPVALSLAEDGLIHLSEGE